MKKIWWGIFSLSMMWLFLLPIFTPFHWSYINLLILGLCFNIWAFWDFTINKVSPFLYLLFIPLIIFIWLIPFPFDLGAILLLLGVLFLFIVHKHKILSPISLGFITSGLIILVQTLILPFFSHFAARYHRIDILNPLFSFLGKIAGLNTSFDYHSLYLQIPERVTSLYTTWENLGLFSLLNILIAGIIIILFFPKFIKTILTLLAVIIGYSIVRYLVLIFILVNGNSMSIFWKPVWVILSFLFLPLILMNTIPLEKEINKNLSFNFLPLKATHLILFFLMFIGAFSFTGFWGFNDPGIKKQGRILWDKGHSDWEWIDRKYDTEWYGQKSGYNYYCLKEYLKYFYSVKVNRIDLAPEILAQYDILIIETPTKPFSSKEINYIGNFVKKGGGLLLIGDHTNVFGMGTYLNPIAQLFGFQFKYDATYDLLTGNLSFYKPPKISPHPVINQMPFFLFATSCSLKAPFFSENVILGYGLRAVEADYSQKNFFPKNAYQSTELEYGLLIQMGGIKYGKGRVLLFTDSTTFSNFYMFIPGKPELILGAMEWLNRQNMYNYVKILFLLISVVSLFLIIYLSKNTKNYNLLLLILFSGLLSSSIGIYTFHSFTKTHYPLPEPYTDYPEVSFDWEHSKFYLPAIEFHPQSKNSLHTFYTWTQRLSIVPKICFEFEDGLKDNDALVIVNPSMTFTEKEKNQFVNYIEKGGKVLLIDDPRRNEISTAYQLLSPFNMSIEYYEIKTGIIANKNGEEIWNGEHLGVVKGGEPLCFIKLREEKKEATETMKKSSRKTLNEEEEKPKLPILSVTNKGKGMLAVFGCSHMFFNGIMGVSSTIPNKSLRKIYNFEYWLFRDLLKVGKEVINE